jgi:spore germination cell wall hydrolase CwlJ-like protein
MRTMINFIVAVLALTVQGLGHAEEAQQQYTVARVESTQVQSTVDRLITNTRDTLTDFTQFATTPWINFSVTSRDEDCLARNIYYEAGSESEEGKVAVAIVTINRVKDGRFDRSICGVVNQRRVVARQQTVEKTEMVRTGLLGLEEPVKRQVIQVEYVPVCQFSWVCTLIRAPKIGDKRWEESQRVAHAVLNGEYEEYRTQFARALYFHAVAIRPVWTLNKKFVARVGGHNFYGDS